MDAEQTSNAGQPPAGRGAGVFPAQPVPADAGVSAARHYTLKYGVTTCAPLYVHQPFGIAKMTNMGMDCGYWALLDSCGLGKTLQAIYAAQCLHAGNVIDKTIIVCKPHLAKNWAEELEEHAPHWAAQVMSGEVPDRRGWIPRADAYVTNYALLTRHQNAKAKLVSPFTGKRFKVGMDAAAMADVMRRNRCLVILDESHTIKNPTSNITQVLCALSQYAAVRFILTATLEGEGAEDVWSQVYFLDNGKLLGQNYKDHKTYYVDTQCTYIEDGRGPGKPLIITKKNGYRHLDELKQKIRAISTRRIYVPSMPPVPKVRYVDAHGAHLRLLRSMRDDLVNAVRADGGDEVNITTGKTARLLPDFLVAAVTPQVFDATIKRSAKVDVLRDVLDETTDQLIIWCMHKQVANAIHAALGSSMALVHGDIPKAKREREIERLRCGDARGLIATQDSLKEGGNFQYTAYAVYAQLPWSIITWDQTMGRQARINQKRAVVTERLIQTQSLDAYQWQNLLAKKQVTSYGGSTGEVRLHSVEFIEALKAW